MDAAQVLDRAGDILRDPAHWSKGYTARDQHGQELDNWHDPAAVCFCIGAAISKAAHELFGESRFGGGPIGNLADRFVVGMNLSDEEAGDCIVRFNDLPQTTHADIVLTLRASAQQARQA